MTFLWFEIISVFHSYVILMCLDVLSWCCRVLTPVTFSLSCPRKADCWGLQTACWDLCSGTAWPGICEVELEMSTFCPSLWRQFERTQQHSFAPSMSDRDQIPKNSMCQKDVAIFLSAVEEHWHRWMRRQKASWKSQWRVTLKDHSLDSLTLWLTLRQLLAAKSHLGNERTFFWTRVSSRKLLKHSEKRTLHQRRDSSYSLYIVLQKFLHSLAEFKTSATQDHGLRHSPASVYLSLSVHSLHGFKHSKL